MKLSPKIMKNSMVVYIAGNIWNASANSPLKIKTKALWVPHPRQSMPKSFLFMQGIIYSSIVLIKFDSTILRKNHKVCVFVGQLFLKFTTFEELQLIKLI